jgi:hypothetical protein
MGPILAEQIALAFPWTILNLSRKVSWGKRPAEITVEDIAQKENPIGKIFIIFQMESI